MSVGATRSGDNVAHVHAQLREAILSGDVRPGERTSQAELARELGVGRTPLREAIRMLQSEGLVLAEPNRRVQIANLSLQDAEELYVARISLEVAAARITTPLLTPTDIAELEGYMAQMAHFASQGLSQFRVPHRAFHECFVRRGGPRLIGLIAELNDHAERYRRASGGASAIWIDPREAEHRAILDGAAAGDPDRVVEALAEHYVITALRITAALDVSPSLERLKVTIGSVAPGALRVFESAAVDRAVAG